MPLQVLLDVPQQRLSQAALSSLVSGPDWDIPMSSGVYRDPISNTSFLYPAGFDPAYTQSNSGAYAKYGLSDFGLGMGWTASNQDGGGPFYHYTSTTGNSGTYGIGGVLTSALVANQAMVVEWFNFSSTSSSRGVIEVGYNNIASGATGVSFRFYADGRAEVWKNGQKVGDYSIAGNAQPLYQGDSNNTQQQTTNQYQLILIIPCRGREVLVLSRGGGGFTHVFEDLPEGVPDNIITSASPFWFNTPSPIEPFVRIAKLQYASSGYLLGKKSYFKTDVPEGQTPQVHVYGDGLTGTASVVDGTTPTSLFSSNANGLRIYVPLSGGTTTPFVYGARAFTNAVTANTGGSGVDVTEFVQKITYEETDSLSGASARITFNSPNGLNALAGGSIEKQSRRSIAISDGDFYFEGVTMAPKVTLGHGINAETIDANTLIEVEVKDLLKLCEDYRFTDPIPLDGMNFSDGYNLLASNMGRVARVSASLASFVFPSAGAPTKNDFNLMIEVGDTGLEWLDRLHKNYAGSYFHGISGTGELLLLDPSDMPSAANVKLYNSIANAGGDPDFVYRSLDATVIEAEANDIYVEGMDFRTRRPIVTHQRDDDSANVSLAPASRPDNWLGGPKLYSLGDPAFTTLACCEWVMSQVFPRLTSARRLIEIEAEFNPAMVSVETGCFRGSLSAFDLYETSRLKTISAEWINTDDSRGGAVWRPTRYVFQQGYDVTVMHARGTSISDIREEHELRSMSDHSRWGGELGFYSSRKPLIDQSEASS